LLDLLSRVLIRKLLLQVGLRLQSVRIELDVGTDLQKVL